MALPTNLDHIIMDEINFKLLEQTKAPRRHGGEVDGAELPAWLYPFSPLFSARAEPVVISCVSRDGKTRQVKIFAGRTHRALRQCQDLLLDPVPMEPRLTIPCITTLSKDESAKVLAAWMAATDPVARQLCLSVDYRSNLKALGSVDLSYAAVSALRFIGSKGLMDEFRQCTANDSVSDGFKRLLESMISQDCPVAIGVDALEVPAPPELPMVAVEQAEAPPPPVDVEAEEHDADPPAVAVSASEQEDDQAELTQLIETMHQADHDAGDEHAGDVDVIQPRRQARSKKPKTSRRETVRDVVKPAKKPRTRNPRLDLDDVLIVPDSTSEAADPMGAPQAPDKITLRTIFNAVYDAQSRGVSRLQATLPDLVAARICCENCGGPLSRKCSKFCGKPECKLAGKKINSHEAHVRRKLAQASQ